MTAPGSGAGTTAEEARSAGEQAAADALREHAAQWIVCPQEAGPGERERLNAECEARLAADPRHRRVFRQMQRMWQAVSPARERRRRAARRRQRRRYPPLYVRLAAKK